MTATISKTYQTTPKQPFYAATPLSLRQEIERIRCQRPAHLVYLSDRFTRLLDERDARIIIQAPVRHGKSQLTSWWLPTWWLRWRRMENVLVTSYSTTFAASWSRRVRNTIRENGPQLGMALADDSQAVEQWNLKGGGGMMARGTGNPPTGWGFGLQIVDDPIESHEEANSETYRETCWNWLHSDVMTRLEPGGHCIVTMARWHEDDVVGRLIESMKNGGEQWEIINIPALAEDDDVLGRAPGDALWPERYGKRALENIRKFRGSGVFNSLYQQRPNSAGGGIFKRSWLRHYTIVGDNLILDAKIFPVSELWHFITVDLAMSVKTTADYTVVCDWAVTPDYELVLWDVLRDRVEAPDAVEAIRKMAQKNDPRYVAIEKAHYGIAVIQQERRLGMAIKELIADKDKVTRAQTAAVMMEGGQVWFPVAAPWLDVFENELMSFPVGGHDDCVDNLSYACREISDFAGWSRDPLVADNPDADDM